MSRFLLGLLLQLIFLREILCVRVLSSVQVLSANETEASISWLKLTSTPSFIFDGYNVKVTPINTFSLSQGKMALELVFPNTTTQSKIIGLHPGTEYNLSMSAIVPNQSSEYISTLFWTEIGKPEIPIPVEILERNEETLKVKVFAGESYNGPVTGLQLIVLERSIIISFHEEQLFNYSLAYENGLPFYVTALLPQPKDSEEFVVGDGKNYGGYFNAPLLIGTEYEVRVGVISSLNGVTKKSFSPFVSSYMDVTFTESNSGWPSSKLTRILAIAIGVFSFLFVALVLLYFLLRRHYAKRRPSDEMVLHDQITDNEENGFAAGILHISDDTNLGDFWELLQERYWSIPRELLEVSDQVLGNGHFGEVRKGVVHKRGKPISVLVQFSQSQSAMKDNERRSLFSEIDAQLRLGSHPNVSEFVGICEDRGILHLVAECFDGSLRGLLLRSRQQAGPRFCNLSEDFIFDLALKMTEGLKYITDHGVLHKRLSSRSIAILENYQPKITNFGLFFYHPAGKKLDYSRWLAPEASRSRTYTVKSDVWSFGVLLWEICTLGGTPFVDVPSQEVYPRSIRGLRLPHPTGVSDELFQLMLQCWELDADERPTFQELATVLLQLSHSPTDHLNFTRVDGFQFHKFDLKGDEI